MDKKKKRDLSHLELSNNTVSSTECTGLQPSPPLTDCEAQAYEHLYAITPQQRSDLADAKNNK